MNKGTVKWFNDQKGYGFIKDSEGNDVFLHYSAIQMEGFKSLKEGEVVEYEIVEDSTGRNQAAVNVTPIITLSMVVHELAKEKLHTERIRDKDGWHGWEILDKDGNVVVDKEMSLIEMAAYVGFDVEGLVKGEE